RLELQRHTQQSIHPGKTLWPRLHFGLSLGSACRCEDEALDDRDRKENCVGISGAADFEAGIAQMRGQTAQIISPLNRDGVVMAAPHPLIRSHANKGDT